MKNIKLISVVALMFAISGCTTVPTISKDSDEYNEFMQFNSVEGKAVIYVYRGIESDHKGQITTIDIGKEELATVNDCVVRHVVDGGDFNIEPNGIGLFAIEKELDGSFPNGSVNAIELKHTSRVALPNSSELFLRSLSDLKTAIDTENLCVIDGRNV